MASARRHVQFAVLILLVTVCGWWVVSRLWFAPVPALAQTPSLSPARPTLQHSPTVESGAVEHPNGAQLGAASMNGKQNAAASIAELHREFEAAVDWRVFAHAARSRPESGGYFYAMRAAEICSRNIGLLDSLGRESLTREIQVRGTTSNRRMELVERLRSRCSGFSDGEAWSFYTQTKDMTRDQKDPLVVARDRVVKAATSRDSAAVRSAALELLSLGDKTAAIQDLLLIRLMRFHPTDAKSSSFWFAGEEVPDDRIGDFQLAYDLVVCERGKPCESNELLALSCISPSGCETDPVKYYREQYVAAGGSEQGFDQVLTLSDRMRSAFEGGSVDSFLRPTSP
jgi:hypothetical protein